MAQPLILFRNPTTGKFVRPLNYAAMRAAEKAGSPIPAPRYDMACMATWGYASGFPKNHDISKAIDRDNGAERGVVGVDESLHRENAEANHRVGQVGHFGLKAGGSAIVTAPATPDARKWSGWGTALKPSWEPIVLARKPLSESSVARNVLEHGCGGIFVDGCRVGDEVTTTHVCETRFDGSHYAGGSVYKPACGPTSYENPPGRWPANTLRTEPFADGRDKFFLTPCFDPEVAKLDDALLEANGFFFVPKASRSEREFGCEGLEESNPAGQVPEDGPNGQPAKNKCRICDRWQLESGNKPVCGCDEPDWELRVYKRAERRNTHPTCKPIALFRHLVRLLTPPGGTCLDPFLGSGTTGCAAELEGFSWIGIEQDEHYCEIAEARTKAWAERAAEGRKQLELTV